MKNTNGNTNNPMQINVRYLVLEAFVVGTIGAFALALSKALYAAMGA